MGPLIAPIVPASATDAFKYNISLLLLLTSSVACFTLPPLSGMGAAMVVVHRQGILWTAAVCIVLLPHDLYACWSPSLRRHYL